MTTDELIDKCLTNLKNAFGNYPDLDDSLKGILIDQIAAATNMLICLTRLKRGASTYDGKRDNEI